MFSGPITSWQINGGKVETVTDFSFFNSKITADDDCSHEIKRHLLFGRKAITNLDSVLKSRGITLPTKAHIVKAMVFSSERMWVLDHKGGWVPKNRCFQIVVLQKTLESPLECKEIKLVNSKEKNQPWIFIGRTDVEAEAPILWPPDVNNWLIGKDPDAGKDWGQEEKGWQRNRWLDIVIDSMDVSLSKFREIVKDRETWHAAAHGIIKNQTRPSNWTTIFLLI